MKEHLKKHSGKDPIRKKVITTINTAAANAAAEAVDQNVLLVNTSTSGADAAAEAATDAAGNLLQCRYCHLRGFESVQLHNTHEMLCEKFPKMVSSSYM